MKLRWERKRLGVYCAFSADGHELAQVAHILGPGGADHGWMVYLPFARVSCSTSIQVSRTRWPQLNERSSSIRPLDPQPPYTASLRPATRWRVDNHQLGSAFAGRRRRPVPAGRRSGR